MKVIVISGPSGSGKTTLSNIILGKRDEVNGKVFGEFAKKIIKKGATILGGCCETDSSHIKELSKLK